MRCACQGIEIAIVEPGIDDVIEQSPTPKTAGRADGHLFMSYGDFAYRAN